MAEERFSELENMLLENFKLKSKEKKVWKKWNRMYNNYTFCSWKTTKGVTYAEW